MADEEKATQRRINITALRKQDPSAGNILDTASSVAHYKFDATTERWVSFCVPRGCVLVHGEHHQSQCC